jgi:hypothetical protein
VLRRLTVWVGDVKKQVGCEPVAFWCVAVVTTAIRGGEVVPVGCGVCAGPPRDNSGSQSSRIGGRYRHVLSVLRDAVALEVLSLIGNCFFNQK